MKLTFTTQKLMKLKLKKLKKLNLKLSKLSMIQSYTYTKPFLCENILNNLPLSVLNLLKDEIEKN